MSSPKRSVWTHLVLLWILLLGSAAAQTDPQGYQHALALYESYQQGESSGDYSRFEQLFMGNPQLTRRAYVSAVEYMTEVYESDPQEMRETLEFASGLADLIAQQFGDSQPQSFINRIVSGDQSVADDFARYAIALYPAYGEGTASSPPPSVGPGYTPGPRPSQRPSGPFRPPDAQGGPPPGRSNNGSTGF